MAFTSQGDVLSEGGIYNINASKQAQTTTNLSLTIPAGNFLLILIAMDNISASTTDGDNVEVTAITDGNDSGNTFFKIKEFSNTQTGSKTGATMSMWGCVLDSQFTSPDALIITFSQASISIAMGIVVRRFTVASGSSVRLAAAGSATSASDAADTGSLTVTPTPGSKEYLWVRATSLESSSTAAWTADTNYTKLTDVGSATGTSTANIVLRSEYRIFTGTTQSTNPTIYSVDNASIFVALEEYHVPVSYNDSISLASTTAKSSSTVLSCSGSNILSSSVSISQLGGILYSSSLVVSASNTITPSCVVSVIQTNIFGASVSNIYGTILDTSGALILPGLLNLGGIPRIDFNNNSSVFGVNADILKSSSLQILGQLIVDATTSDNYSQTVSFNGSLLFVSSHTYSGSSNASFFSTTQLVTVSVIDGVGGNSVVLQLQFDCSPIFNPSVGILFEKSLTFDTFNYLSQIVGVTNYPCSTNYDVSGVMTISPLHSIVADILLNTNIDFSITQSANLQTLFAFTAGLTLGMSGNLLIEVDESLPVTIGFDDNGCTTMTLSASFPTTNILNFGSELTILGFISLNLTTSQVYDSFMSALAFTPFYFGMQMSQSPSVLVTKSVNIDAITDITSDSVLSALSNILIQNSNAMGQFSTGNFGVSLALPVGNDLAGASKLAIELGLDLQNLASMVPESELAVEGVLSIAIVAAQSEVATRTLLALSQLAVSGSFSTKQFESFNTYDEALAFVTAVTLTNQNVLNGNSTLVIIANSQLSLLPDNFRVDKNFAVVIFDKNNTSVLTSDEVIFDENIDEASLTVVRR